MKKYIYLSLISIFLASCAGEDNAKKEQQTTQETQEVVAISVDDLLNNKDQYSGKEVLFKGTVDHVCKHSGKRAFVFGSKDDVRIKIEAGGEIRGFDAELLGQDIQVKGKLVETRIDDEYIAKLEGDLNNEIKGLEHHESEGKEEANTSEDEIESRKAQIENLKKQIAESEKGYISNYYIDGISYEVVK